MTDKQFSSLRRTIIGAVILIWGTMLMEEDDIALLIVLFGLVLMLKDAIEDWVNWFNKKYPPIDEEKEKEDESK